MTEDIFSVIYLVIPCYLQISFTYPLYKGFPLICVVRKYHSLYNYKLGVTEKKKCWIPDMC